ncbi:hypothetical protein BJX65DRAFT_130848 [Aspergillus insuetus]
MLRLSCDNIPLVGSQLQEQPPSWSWPIPPFPTTWHATTPNSNAKSLCQVWRIGSRGCRDTEYGAHGGEHRALHNLCPDCRSRSGPVGLSIRIGLQWRHAPVYHLFNLRCCMSSLRCSRASAQAHVAPGDLDLIEMRCRCLRWTLVPSATRLVFVARLLCWFLPWYPLFVVLSRCIVGPFEVTIVAMPAVKGP